MANSECLNYVCVAIDLDGNRACRHIESYCGDMAALGRDDYAECVADYADYSLAGSFEIDGSTNCFPSAEACESICNPGRVVSTQTTSSAQPETNIISSKTYKPAVSYQKQIDITYNTNYGLGINPYTSSDEIDYNREPYFTNVNPEYRYGYKPTENIEPENKICICGFSNNTRNTGSNRYISDEIKNQGFTKLDDVGLLPNQNMRNGNFNFITGKIEYNREPPTTYSKNIVHDNAQNNNVPPKIATGGNDQLIFSQVMNEPYPISPSDTLTTGQALQCSLVWVCINNIYE